MFCVSALAQYTVRDITHLFYKYKVNFETRTTGQLFAFSASSVLHLLESVIDTQNTRFAYDNKILSVTKNADIFEVKTDKQIFYAKNVVRAWRAFFTQNWAQAARPMILQEASALPLPPSTPPLRA